MGTMPIEDYNEIMAMQYGFDSYEDLRKQGYRLATDNDFKIDDKGAPLEFDIQEMTKTEMMYASIQSDILADKVGFVGHIIADTNTDSETLFSKWNCSTNHFMHKADEFKKEFNEVMASIKTDEKFNNNTLRVNTEKYVYIMRIGPSEGKQTLVCHCYLRSRFDIHLQIAKQGIQFLDSKLCTKFKLQDGGKIRINRSDGIRLEEKCRYVYNRHFEVGNELYSIYEFADCMEQNGNTIQPLEGLFSTPMRKVKNRDITR